MAVATLPRMMALAEKDEVHLKLVYFGPGLAGKTTNLQYVFARTDPARRTEMRSRATETERLLWFGLTPHTLPPVFGKQVRVFLYTVPGAVFYDESRRTLLEGADGVVFVADTQVERIEANLESLAQLEELLAGLGRDLTELPFVIQYNKRDLPNRTPLAELEHALNPRRVPQVDAVATIGRGVFETLRACAKGAYERISEPNDGP